MKIHGSVTQVTGIPDVLGCYRGRFVALEVKKPTRSGRPQASSRQELTIRRIVRAGGFARVIDDPSQALWVLDQIDDQLRRM